MSSIFTEMDLTQILNTEESSESLLSLAQTQGFITSMASAPLLIDPAEWLAFLWGGEEVSPFTSQEQLEHYANQIVNLWNQYRSELLSGQWVWPESCRLDEADIVSEETRHFTEGLLQGWQLTRDDWETFMPEESEDNALLGGVLLSVSMLFDPETALATLSEQGIEGLDEFELIYNGIPTMLCGLTQKGHILAQESDEQE